jgi:hypothetical protein
VKGIIPIWVEKLRGKTEREVSRVSGWVGKKKSEDVGRFRVQGAGDFEVHVSKYDRRDPPTVITHSPRYDETTVSVILDVYGDSDFVVSRDHFLILSLEDKEDKDEVRIRVRGPGRYEGVSKSRVNNWEEVLCPDIYSE